MAAPPPADTLYVAGLTSDDYQALERQLIRHEGLRLRPYRDTAGKLTIGVGRNLTDVGITSTEAMALLDHDVAVAVGGLALKLPWGLRLDAIRQRALIDLVFNLGIDGLLGFPTFLELFRTGQYAAAADDLLKTKLAHDAPRRTAENAAMIRTGQEPTA